MNMVTMYVRDETEIPQDVTKICKELSLVLRAVLVGDSPAAQAELQRRSGFSITPQIFIDDQLIGGVDEFVARYLKNLLPIGTP